MGGLSVWHWLIFLVVALLLFGGSGKISSIMGDVAKGIKSFKKGMTEDDATAAAPAQDPFKKDEPQGHRQRGGQAGGCTDHASCTDAFGRAGTAAQQGGLRPAALRAEGDKSVFAGPPARHCRRRGVCSRLSATR